jgi:type IV pilus assembly protein PilA
MLKQLKKIKSEGFTIIEVMIVLAIAGLILVIVLLAVPALQRNSRNTAMKSDSGAVTAAISEYESNNDGAQPANTGVVSAAGVVTFGAAGTSQAVAKVQGTTTVTAYAFASRPASVLASNVGVIYGAKCNNGSNYTAVGDVIANTRSVAVIYPVEGAGSTVTNKCIDS